MKARSKTPARAIRKEGSLQRGPILSSDDPEFKGTTREERRAEIAWYARNYGGLSGLEDFFDKCHEVAVQMRKRRGELAAECAGDLDREARRLEAELVNAPPALREQIYRAAAAGFAYANLKHELERGAAANGDTFSMEDYFAAQKKGNKKDAIARELGVSVRWLSKWVSKNLA